MHKLFGLSAAILLSGYVTTPIAYAGEWRVGFIKHDVDIPGLGGAREKESSEAIALEFLFDSPEMLERVWAPKPYVYVSGNLGESTSHAGAGLAWRKGFWDYYYGEFAFGLSVHDGEERVDNPADAATDRPDLMGQDLLDEIQRRFDRKNDTIEFGSTALFRVQFAIGYEWTDNWATEVVYEHLSNGRIIGGPENEGLDNVGLRIAYRY